MKETTESKQARRDAILSRLDAMTLEQRGQFATNYAQARGIPFEDAAMEIVRIRSGETFDHLDQLEHDVARLDREIRALQRMASVHVPEGRPWMMALEMQFAALRRNVDYVRNQTSPSWLNHVSSHLRHAECYSFTTETAAAIALASKTIPMESRVGRQVFPSHAGWWWFQKAITVPGLDKDSDQCEALSWGQSEQGVWVFGWLRDYDKGFHRDPIPVYGEQCIGESSLSELQAASSKGKDPNEAASKTAGLHIWRFILAGTAWLQQRIVTSSSGHIERHRRKQLARENAVVVSDVKVIELRRRETSTALSVPCSHEVVEWSCRWVVNGHWRNQPYANGERKLIYIMPFVKGPSDKPLRVPTHTVYQVSR